MGVLPIIIIATFTTWTILGERKGSSVMQFIFLASFGAWIFTVLQTNGWEGGFPTLAISFLVLAAYGFIIQNIFTNNAVRCILGVIAISPFMYNKVPLTLQIESKFSLHSKLDADAEFIIKCDHEKVSSIKEKLSSMSQVKSVSSWSVTDADDTELDDYLIVDIDNDFYNYKMFQRLESIPGVEYIEENEAWQSFETNASTTHIDSKVATGNVLNDPRLSDQWSANTLQLELFHEMIAKSGIKPVKKARLYILDSGVNFDHEDLRGNLYNHESPDKDSNETDSNGHGTHCAGIAGAVTNNGLGIASFNPSREFVEVGSVAVMNRFGFATQSKIIEGMIEAADAGADVINMSFGGLSNQIMQEAYEDAFAYLKKRNVISVAAAGNSAADASIYLPSGRDDVITVSATNKTNDKAQFSNYVQNTTFGIAAPGTSILSTYKNGYSSFDGTSMAAPHVAGLVAVLRSINPSMTTETAFDILNDTGIETSRTLETGVLIQPVDALKAVLD